jgi:hypothetical protein
MDENVYPTRGQTVLVKAPQVKRTIGTALSTGAYRPAKPTSEECNVFINTFHSKTYSHKNKKLPKLRTLSRGKMVL